MGTEGGAATERRRRRARSIAKAGMAAIVVVVTLGVSASAAAAESISEFRSRVSVSADGTIGIVESITYDFGNERRRGIFRVIPDRFPYEPDDSFRRLTPISRIGVTSATAPSATKVFREGDATVIRVGEENTFIDGVHTYEISYRLAGAINAFDDHDEIYLNITGNGWPVSMSRVVALIDTPVPPIEIGCFRGRVGSNRRCGDASSDGSLAQFRADRLGPGEGLTVVIALPAGTIANADPILEERWSLARAFRPNPLSVAGLVFGMAGVIWLARRLYVAGRDRQRRGGPLAAVFVDDPSTPEADEELVPLLGGVEIPVELVPPDRLPPGLLGTLVDEEAHPVDVTATIVDLAVRGYLRIEELPTDDEDWRLVKLDPPATDRRGPLHRYEQLLLDHLFVLGDDVRLSTLRTKFAAEMKEVQDALYEEVVERGWFNQRPDEVRQTWLGLGLVTLVVGGAASAFLIAKTSMGLVTIPLLTAGLVMLANGRRMPRRTAKGTGVVRQTLGFRRFIMESEKHRARFAEEQNIFSEYLPYAVMFGATERWARTFEDLAVGPTGAGATGTGRAEALAPSMLDWYVGTRLLSLSAFGRRVESFNVATAGTLTAVPVATSSASGGFSGLGGGGFSGGGFGGGGGGSW